MGKPDGVIIASPVRQQPEVLREFLRSLGSFEPVWLYDDNDNVESRHLVEQFCVGGRERLAPLPLPAVSPYRRLTTAHFWTAETYGRVAAIKDHIIGEFLRSDAEYLFLVDSDVLIPPGLIGHLVGLGLPIVSEIFWTRWNTQTPRLPQVWQTHPRGYLSADWIVQLRTPGVYRVGGLGACTLLRRDALERGITFAPIDGLEYHGEDRYFCVRASVVGIPLHVDAQMPAYHVYREDDLSGGVAWLEQGCPPETVRGWLDDEWEARVRYWLKEATATESTEGYIGGTEPWIADLLVALCRAIDARRGLEIGVYKGKTTAALATCLTELVGIDREVRVDAINAVARFPHVKLLEGDAVDITRNLSGSFGFVFIDDGHRYSDVRAQTETVWPLIRSGGVLAFHDALGHEDDCGVKRYINERFPGAIFLQTRPFPWTTATGLALVVKG